MGVAEDPPGVEWVYIADGKGQPEGYKSIYRCQLGNLSRREVVWDKTPSIDKWEFTRDGKLGASRFPLTVASVSLPNGEFLPVAQIGCTPGLSADTTTVMHMMVVTHAGIILYNRDGSNRREIYFTQGPPALGLNNNEFWWTSFVRYDGNFITFGGPYERAADAPGNIYFCQLNEKRSAIAQWVRVTEDHECNIHPYGWIDSDNFGPKLTDKLSVKLLASAVSKLAAAKEYKPVLEEMEKTAADQTDKAKADEAKMIIAHVKGWGRYALRLAQEQEATDFPAALARYKELSAKFSGLEAGAEAKKKLDDPELAREPEAWKLAGKILAAEKALTAPPGKGSPGRVDMAALRSALETLKKDHAASRATAAAQEAWPSLEAWPKKQMDAAQALEAEKPVEAEALYTDLIAKLGDGDDAKAARARLNDKVFKRNLTAWNSYLTPIIKAEEALKAVPKAKASAMEKVWLQKNAFAVGTIKAGALGLKRDYADTAAWKEAQKVLAKYEIELNPKS